MKQAKEILEIVEQLYKDYPKSEDEGVEALRVLIFEKKLERILGKEKYQGVSIREIKEGELMLVHDQANLYCKKTAANAVSIKIVPYGSTD